MQTSASVYASQSGAALGSGGVFFPQQQQQHRQRQRHRNLSHDHNFADAAGGGAGAVGSEGGGAGGASAQGGMGGAGRGGFIHVYDERRPPDFGRIPEPEDILGSLQVDSTGKFVDGNGYYSESGTYRVLTREGILGLSTFLRERLVERLQEIEREGE